MNKMAVGKPDGLFRPNWLLALGHRRKNCTLITAPRRHVLLRPRRCLLVLARWRIKQRTFGYLRCDDVALGGIMAAGDWALPWPDLACVSTKLKGYGGINRELVLRDAKMLRRVLVDAPLSPYCCV